MRQIIRDLQMLIGMAAIAAYTTNAYFKEWAAMDATMGIEKIGHAIMMTLLGLSALASIAMALAILVVWTLEYRVIRRQRRHDARIATRSAQRSRVSTKKSTIRTISARV